MEVDVDKPEDVKELPHVDTPSGDNTGPAENSGKVATKGKVVFRVKNKNTPSGESERVFSLEDHGEDFEKLADEFEKVNASEILKRD